MSKQSLLNRNQRHARFRGHIVKSEATRKKSAIVLISQCVRMPFLYFNIYKEKDQ